MVFKKSDDSSGGGLPPRKMFTGNWSCTECKAEITELPFEPDPDRSLFCRDCLRKKRAQRFER